MTSLCSRCTHGMAWKEGDSLINNYRVFCRYVGRTVPPNIRDCSQFAPFGKSRADDIDRGYSYIVIDPRPGPGTYL